MRLDQCGHFSPETRQRCEEAMLAWQRRQRLLLFRRVWLGSSVALLGVMLSLTAHARLGLELVSAHISSLIGAGALGAYALMTVGLLVAALAQRR